MSRAEDLRVPFGNLGSEAGILCSTTLNLDHSSGEIESHGSNDDETSFTLLFVYWVQPGSC